MSDLILASTSPRRRELLAQIGVDFEVCAVDVPEQMRSDEAADTFVQRLAREKAQAGFRRAGGGLPALGADTVVVIDGRILGKPRDEQDAVAMLQMLSGRRHRVMTGVALVGAGRTASQVVVTEVTFGELSEALCRRYWASGEPRDKAGGYAIQGLGAVFVTGISGSYSSVVGLPLAETSALLAQFGVPLWFT